MQLERGCLKLWFERAMFNFYTAGAAYLAATHRLAECCSLQWQRGLRRGSAAARVLALRVEIPPGAWMSASCVCCVLLGRGCLRHAR
jgi:hypothetical protein